VRVLYFSRDYTPHDHRFLAALAESDHAIYYLRLEQRGHPVEARPLPPNIEAVSWSGGQRPASLLDLPGLFIGLKEVLRRVKPDLIHAGPLQSCAWLAAMTGFRPLVSMSWGYDLMQDAERNAFWGWMTRFTLRRSTVMVGDCDAVRNQAIRFGMQRDRIVIFPWGVDLTRFAPGSSDRKNSERFTLLSVRSWEPVYGVDAIARAFVRAAQQHPDLYLVMLGAGSQAELIQNIFSEGGVVERVAFPGQVSQTALPDYYRDADLYLSASHTDGSSVSLLEALASGCPVLVSNILGNREWVQPGINGWLFKDGDSVAMAQAIIQAKEQRQNLAEIGLAARRIAEQRADWRKNFPELLHAYSLAVSS
jgi:glycosyltransferase involved in cell wall biosynthesis